jgi:putative flavoprotein involved in K+ transport
MTEQIDTVVIGGGQAGLSISYYLTQQDREHVVLEKNRIGETWRSRRWDSFTLVTPNWQLQLPGFPYNGDNPDGYLPKEEIVRYLEDYAAIFDPPVRLGVEARSVESNSKGDGYRIETSAGVLEASNVVVATGTFQMPSIPNFSQKIMSRVVQIHSSRYQNADALPPGAVLVVGSGQSGCQIAEELNQSGRKVYLCTSEVGRAPRRYRGKDFIKWLDEIGMIDNTVDTLDSPEERFSPNPHVSGKNGGRTLNLQRFARNGVTLLGRLKNARRSKIELEKDLMDNLAMADQFASELKKGIDTYIEKAGIDAPEENHQELNDGYDHEVITELDLESENITSIIWAVGYDFDFSWIKFPVFDEFGYPIQKRGVTEQPGLYFLGLHWMHTLKSGLFFGVGDDAAHIAGHIADR